MTFLVETVARVTARMLLVLNKGTTLAVAYIQTDITMIASKLDMIEK